jgi:hypothetical protein
VGCIKAFIDFGNLFVVMYSLWQRGYVFYWTKWFPSGGVLHHESTLNGHIVVLEWIAL